jgi:hypothetical protein
MHSPYPKFVLSARPSHPPWLDNSNYTWQTVQVMKLLIKQFSIFGCFIGVYFISLCYIIFQVFLTRLLFGGFSITLICAEMFWPTYPWNPWMTSIKTILLSQLITTSPLLALVIPTLPWDARNIKTTRRWLLYDPVILLSSSTGLLQDPAYNGYQFKAITLKAVIPNINQLHITAPSKRSY